MAAGEEGGQQTAAQRSEFGALLRHWRTVAGLTQEELAAAARLGVRTIRDLERGTTSRPYRHSVEQLADALALGGPGRAEFVRTARPVADRGGPSAERVVPRQLPAASSAFTGRSAELATLTRLLSTGPRTTGPVLVSAIGGTAGVGKTSLAVHWAHRVAADFPDGQLYINLCGYDPAQPMPAADALAAFLRALGVAGADIPTTLADRAARYRSLLAGRRMLVVLDNANSAEQVRPLLPGAPACLVLVTSRDALHGLVARDGARRLDLDLFSPADASALLTRLIGNRAAADPAATAALARQCGRLPLALRVAAELAVARPGVPLADLAAELADRQQRLELLEAGGDPRTAVRAVFSWSYRSLAPAAARTFRLLSLHPGPDADSYDVAALTDASTGETQQALDQLVRASLAYSTAAGRFGLHDLLRDYAAELSGAEDGTDRQRAALTRLFDHYLHAAAVATDVLFPAERARRPRVSHPATPMPQLAGRAQARGWLDAQRASLVSASRSMAQSSWPAHATKLSAVLFPYLNSGTYYPEAFALHSQALRAALETGDRWAEAAALTSLGALGTQQDRFPEASRFLRQSLTVSRAIGDRAGQAVTRLYLGIATLQPGRYADATEHLRRSLLLARESGDRLCEARAQGYLGSVARRQGRYSQAVTHFQRALMVSRAIGDREGEGMSLSALALIDLRQGRYRRATSYHRQALTLYREAGDRGSEAHALANFSVVAIHQGRYEQATAQLHRALTLAEEIGDRGAEVIALTKLGTVCLRQGRPRPAIKYLQQALTVCREIGYRLGETEALNGLGEVSLATGRPELACQQHTTALGLATELGVKYEQAQAHHGLGHAHDALGEPALAHQHWQQALDLFGYLGCPEANLLLAHLTAAGQTAGRRTAAVRATRAASRDPLLTHRQPGTGGAVHGRR